MGGQAELVGNHLAGRDPFAQCSLETGGGRDLESESEGNWEKIYPKQT